MHSLKTTEQLQKYESENKILHSKIEQLELKIANRKEDFKKIFEEIKLFQTREIEMKKKYEEKTKIFKNQIDTFKLQLNSYIEKNDQLLNIIEQKELNYQKEKDKSDKKLQKLEFEIEKSNSDISSLIKKEDEYKNIIKTIKDKSHLSDVELTKLKFEKEHLLGEIESRDSRIKTGENELISVRSTLNLKINTLESMILKLKSEKEDLFNETDTQRQLILEKEEDKSYHKTNNKHFEVQSLMSQLEAARLNLKITEEDLIEAKERFDKVMEEKTKLYISHEQTLLIVNHCNQEINELKTKFAIRDLESKEYEQTIDRLKQEQRKLLSNNYQLENAYHELQEELEQIKETNSQLVSNLKDEFNNTKQISEKLVNVSDLRYQIENLKIELIEKDQIINGFQSELENQKTIIKDKLQLKFTDYKNKISFLQNENSQLAFLFNQKNQETEEFNNKILNLEIQIENLKNEKNDLKIELSKVNKMHLVSENEGRKSIKYATIRSVGEDDLKQEIDCLKNQINDLRDERNDLRDFHLESKKRTLFFKEQRNDLIDEINFLKQNSFDDKHNTHHSKNESYHSNMHINDDKTDCNSNNQYEIKRDNNFPNMQINDMKEENNFERNERRENKKDNQMIMNEMNNKTEDELKKDFQNKENQKRFEKIKEKVEALKNEIQIKFPEIYFDFINSQRSVHEEENDWMIYFVNSIYLILNNKNNEILEIKNTSQINERELESIKEMYEELKSECQIINDNSIKLSEENLRLFERIEEQNETIEKMELKCNDLSKMNIMISKKVSETDQDLKQKISCIRSYEINDKESSNMILHLKNFTQELQVISDEQSQKIESLNSEKKILENDIKTKENINCEFDCKIKQYESEIERLNSDLDIQQQRTKSFFSQLQQMTEDIQKEKSRIQEQMTESKQELQKRYDLLKEKSQSYSVQNKKYEDNILQLQNQLVVKTQEHDSLAGSFEKVKVEYSHLIGKTEEFEKIIENLKPWRQNFDNLNSEFISLKNQNISFKNDLQKMNLLEEENQELKNEIGKMNLILQDYELLKIDNRKLTVVAQDIELFKNQTDKINTISQQNEQLITDNQRLNIVIQEYEQLKTDNQRLNIVVQENEQLKNEMEKVELINQENEHMKSEIINWKNEYTNLKVNYKNINNEYHDLTNEYANLKTDYTNLNNDFNNIKYENSNLTIIIEKSQEEINKIKTEFKEERGTFQTKIQKMNEKMNEMSSIESQLKSLLYNMVIKILRHQNVSIEDIKQETIIENYEKIKIMVVDKLDEYSENEKRLQKELNDVKSEVAYLTLEMNSKNDESVSDLKQLKNHNRLLNENLLSFKEEKNTFQKNQKQIRDEMLKIIENYQLQVRERLENILMQNSFSEIESNFLLSQVNHNPISNESDLKMIEIHNENFKLIEDKIEGIVSQIKLMISNQNEKIEILKEQNDSLLTQNQRDSQTIFQLRSSLKTANAELNKMDYTINELKNSYNELKSNNAELVIDYDKLKSNNTELNNRQTIQNENYLEKIKEYEKEIKDLNDKNSLVMKGNKVLIQQIDELKRSPNNQNEDKIKQLTQLNDRLENELKKSLEKKSQLINENENYKQMISQLQLNQQNNVAMVYKLQDSNRKIHEIRERSVSIEKSIDSKNNNVLEISKKYEELLKKYNMLVTENTSLQEVKSEKAITVKTSDNLNSIQKGLMSKIESLAHENLNLRGKIQDLSRSDKETMRKAEYVIEEMKNRMEYMIKEKQIVEGEKMKLIQSNEIMAAQLDKIKTELHYKVNQVDFVREWERKYHQELHEKEEILKKYNLLVKDMSAQNSYKLIKK